MAAGGADSKSLEESRRFMPSLYLLAVSKVPRLCVPPGRGIDGESSIDESINGRRGGAIRSPLEGEWHKLPGRYRADSGLLLRTGQRRDEKDPINLVLVDPVT